MKKVKHPQKSLIIVFVIIFIIIGSVNRWWWWANTAIVFMQKISFIKCFHFSFRVSHFTMIGGNSIISMWTFNTTDDYVCLCIFVASLSYFIFARFPRHPRSLCKHESLYGSFVRAFLKTECKTTKTTITLKYQGFNANVIFAFSGLLMNATT